MTYIKNCQCPICGQAIKGDSRHKEKFCSFCGYVENNKSEVVL